MEFCIVLDKNINNNIMFSLMQWTANKQDLLIA